MGSWNGTCGISQLPITSGTKVKTFVMLQQERCSVGGSGVCYSTAYFRPWFFPVTAEYNDYGSIDKIEEDWNSKYMLEIFQLWHSQGKIKILGDEAEWNSPDVDKFNKLEDVFECIERGAILFKAKGSNFNHKKQKWISKTIWLRIGMFMVLEPVYDALVKEHARHLAEGHEYYRKHALEEKETALEKINKVRAKVAEGGLTEIDMLHTMSIDTFLGDLIEEHYAFKHYKNVLLDPKRVSVEDFFAAIEPAKAISSCMSYLRKLWIPQSGQGSQCEELSFNKALIDGMQIHMARRDAEFARQEEEERQWEEEQAAKKKATA